MRSSLSSYKEEGRGSEGEEDGREREAERETEDDNVPAHFQLSYGLSWLLQNSGLLTQMITGYHPGC